MCRGSRACRYCDGSSCPPSKNRPEQEPVRYYDCTSMYYHRLKVFQYTASLVLSFVRSQLESILQYCNIAILGEVAARSCILAAHCSARECVCVTASCLLTSDLEGDTRRGAAGFCFSSLLVARCRWVRLHAAMQKSRQRKSYDRKPGVQAAEQSVADKVKARKQLFRRSNVPRGKWLCLNDS